MAVRNRTWDEEVARWTRVGELGMEGALREIGCPEHRISKALEKNNKARFDSRASERSNVREAGSPTSSMSETADLGESGHVDSGDFIELEHTSSKSDRADSGEKGHGDSDDWEPDRYTELERSTILATVGRGISRVELVYLREEVTENEVTAFCVNLTANKKIKTLDVSGAHSLFRSRTGCTLLGNALATNPAIETLDFRSVGMGSDGVKCLMKGLQRNRTLEHLDLGENPLEDEGVNLVAELLAGSTTLKSLDLTWVGCGLEGAKHLSSALARNTSLEELSLSFGMFYVDDFGRDSRYEETQSREYDYLEGNPMFGADLVEGYRVILESLSPNLEDAALSQNVPKNSALRKLTLWLPTVLQDTDPTYLESLTLVIKTNRTLHELTCWGFKLAPQAWKEQFFPALKENATLKQVGLLCCVGLTGDVFEALMDVLQNSNTALEKIDLGGTNLREKQPQVDEELRINQEYRSALRGQPMVPTTSGRLVLCGRGFGG